MATSSHLDQGALSAPALRIEAPPKITVNHHEKKRMRLRRRRIAWGLGVVAVIGAGTAWFLMNRGPQPTPVQLATVARADLQARVTANGKVQAQKKVDMSATIAGQITRLAVEEGDRVAKGQFLLQIDATNPRAVARSTEASMAALGRELDSARAQLEQARVDFRRAEENHQAQIISTADLDQARTALSTAEAMVLAAERRVEQARATLDGARDTLQKTTVVAPMAGTVTARRVEEGEVAVIGVLNQPGTVLLTISDMSVVEAEMEVDETSIPSVRVGQEARVRIDAYPNRTFDGVVTEVGSSPMDPTEMQQQTEAIKFKVKVEIKDPPDTIKPGLSVQADILTGFAGQAVVVPLQALVVRDIPREPGATPAPGAPREEEGVYLVKDGKAEFQAVETGLLGELDVEVRGGLEGGETLVTGPFRALRSLKPGDAVTEAEEPAHGPTES
ncbi:MAG: efflux RND transporter periplasmic adaptor subunit [Acidobacteria bacterium]|nr:efflux RND transporter periplasmic adaptor subunit [Acidobacteriota bacterium]